MGVTSRQFPRLREGLAGGVAGGLALAALGFGLQSRLVQRFLLRRPVAVDLSVVQRVLLAAEVLVSICMGGGVIKENVTNTKSVHRVCAITHLLK